MGSSIAKPWLTTAGPISAITSYARAPPTPLITPSRGKVRHSVRQRRAGGLAAGCPLALAAHADWAGRDRAELRGSTGETWDRAAEPAELLEANLLGTDRLAHAGVRCPARHV